MLDDIKSTFGNGIDRLKDAAGVLVSDPQRLGAAFVFAIVVFGVVIGSAYTINIAATATGKTVVWTCPKTNSYILPLLTNPTNMSAAFPQIQCTIGSADIGAILAYFIEVIILIFGVVWLAIAVLNLSG